MSEQYEATPRGLTRRRFLQGTVIVSAAAIAAACAPTAAPSGGSPAAGSPAPAARKRGAFNMAWPYDVPPKGHYNYAAAGGILRDSSHLSDLTRPSFATYRWVAGKWDHWLSESGKLDGSVYELKLRKGLKFDDGSALTSKDVVTTFWVLRVQGGTIWNFIDKIEAPDDVTVRFNFKTPTSLAERFVLRERVMPDKIYGTLAKKAQDLYGAGKATTSDEVKAVRKEMEDLRPTEPFATGPFKIDTKSVSEASLTLVLNANGILADKVSFDKILVYFGETAQVTPLVLAGDIDYATHGFPLATDKAIQEKGLKILRGPLYTGPALYFHWENAPQFQDKRLRQAVAHAIDRNQSGALAYGESAKAPKYNAGFGDALVPQWVASADLGKLKAYEFDQKKAEDLLKAAGYAKGGDGIWAKDGKKLEFEMAFPSDFADWSAAAQHASETLNKFGIKITLRGSPNSQQSADFLAGKFQIGFRPWGIGNPHPQASITRPIREFSLTASGGGSKYPAVHKTDAVGEIDWGKLLDESIAGFDAEKQKPAVTKMALAFNELLPCVPLWERALNSPVNDQARVTGWPPLTDDIFKNSGADNPVALLIMDGTLKAK
jgi:peptide/nickel transport system substrate-binding protein